MDYSAFSPKPLTPSSDPSSPYPTTFVQADTSSFKHVVQMLTGSPSPNPPLPSRLHSIPPIKPAISKKPGPVSSGFKLYERRNSHNNLKINPLHPLSGFFAAIKPDILSPSILDFPSLALSPVTPLTHDPFSRSPTTLGPVGQAGSPDERGGGGGGVSPGRADAEAEERGIREKGFFLHPSPRGTEPKLLPLFPVTSPRVSGD
ncbi:hypothetical protein MLD38_039893 [Melastoma candidum]|uniref:Uncharacterized protein n=1 Tax=Melastoma candidum TaxID=119954 RepID=A0ACB9L4R9_9MYRT|nr:hypothetical protein MLD38_039893 [Melastoma candidum]